MMITASSCSKPLPANKRNRFNDIFFVGIRINYVAAWVGLGQNSNTLRTHHKLHKR